VVIGVDGLGAEELFHDRHTRSMKAAAV